MAAIFLVVMVRPGAENDVRELLADVAGVTRAVGFRSPDDELSCVVDPAGSALSAVGTGHGRLLGDGEIVWAPALDGAVLVSTRGGDYELHLGQDLSIGYLSHDADHIELYLQESLTFPAITAESSVILPAGEHRG